MSFWPCGLLPAGKLSLRPKSSPGPGALSPHPAPYLVAASQASMALASRSLLRCSVLLRHVPRTPLASTEGKWVTRSTRGEAGTDVIGVMQNLAAYGHGHYSQPHSAFQSFNERPLSPLYRPQGPGQSVGPESHFTEGNPEAQ